MSLLTEIHNDLEKGALRLIAEYRDRLFADAVRLCGDVTTAEDLVSRTFDKVIRNLDSYKEDNNFFGWMKTIMVNLHHDELRSPIRRATSPVDPKALEESAEADWNTDELILRHSDSEALKEAISRLDPEYKKILVMHYFGELPAKNIALALNLPLGTVLWRLCIARRILAKDLGAKLGKKPVVVVLSVLLAAGALFGAWQAGVGEWLAGDDARTMDAVGESVPPPPEVVIPSRDDVLPVKVPMCVNTDKMSHVTQTGRSISEDAVQKETDEVKLFNQNVQFGTWGRSMTCMALASCLTYGARAMTITELQSAIDATPDGGRVELTGDVDLTAPLNVDGRKLTLASPEGERYTITRASGTTRFLAKIENANTLFRLENLEFDGNKAAYGGTGPEVPIIEIGRGVVELGAGTVLRDVLVKSGGSIYVHTAGKLVMEDGAEIRNFTNPNYGAAVRVGGSYSYTDGTFEMRGGLITGCHSSYAALNMGGAVYLYGGRFAMSGGVISNNTAAAGCVAGVNLYAGVCDISGSAQIINNHGGRVDDFVISGGGSCQVYVRPGYTGRMTIYQSSLPTIGATSLVWTGPNGTKNATGLGNVSVQGHPDYVLDGYYSSGGYSRWGRKMLEVSSRGVMATISEFWGTQPLRDNDVVTLSTNLAWASNWTIENVTNVTFTSDANGPWALERGKENFQFLSVKNASVRFENIVLEGRGETYPITVPATPDASMLFVQSNGHVTFGSGAVLRNAKSNQRAPGVVLDGTNSVFRMEEGSAIVDCVADGEKSYASAVMLGNGKNDEPRPRFEMTGGVISNCTCEIDTAKASVGSGYGGVVYIYGGQFEMTGGHITENHSATTCSGVQYYSGIGRMSGDAQVAGNEGPYRDAYVRSGSADNVRMFGDFRGRVGLANTTIAAGSAAGVTAEADATGAWCFFPALQGDSPRYVGLLDGTDGKTIRWGTVVGRIGDAEFAAKADAEKACPSSLKLDEEGRAQLPIAFGGVATEIEKTIALDFDSDEMRTLMETHGGAFVLFRADEGLSFKGTIQFLLPEGCEDRFFVSTRGSVCKLDLKRGMVFIVR